MADNEKKSWWTGNTTSSAIQAGGGIASSLINIIGQNYINNRNIEEQRRAQAQAQEYWIQQQEYNSPKNQLARIQEAGLNPDMLYGQSSSGVAGNAPTPAQTINPPTLNPYFLDPMIASDISKNISEIAKNKADAKKSNSEAELANQQKLTEEEKRTFQQLQNFITDLTLIDQINVWRNKSAITTVDYYQKRLNMNETIFDQATKLSIMGIPYSLIKDKDAGVVSLSIDNWDGKFLTAKGEQFLDYYWKKEYGLPDSERKEAIANARYFNQLAIESETLLPDESKGLRIDNLVKMFDLALEGATYGIKVEQGADGLPVFDLKDVSEDNEAQAQQWIRTFAGLLNLDINLSAINYQGGGLETQSVTYDKNGKVKSTTKTQQRKIRTKPKIR